MEYRSCVEQDLADMVAAFHDALRFRRFGKRQHLVNDGPYAAAADERPCPGFHFGGQGSLEGGISRPEHASG